MAGEPIAIASKLTEQERSIVQIYIDKIRYLVEPPDRKLKDHVFLTHSGEQCSDISALVHNFWKCSR